MESHQAITHAAHALDAAFVPFHEELKRSVPTYKEGMVVAYDPFYADGVAIGGSPAEQISDFGRDIRARRIDLVATRVGRTLLHDEPGLTASLMNPRHDMVWSVRIPDAKVAVQLALSPDPSVNVRAIASTYLKHEAAIIGPAYEIAGQQKSIRSLADTLDKDSPSLDGHIVVAWDVPHSTEAVRRDFSRTKRYLGTLAERFADIADKHDATRIPLQGDGQFIGMELPAPARLDLGEAGRFFLQEVAPLVTELKAAGKEIAASDRNILDMHSPRFGIGIGRTEPFPTGETTGGVLWEVHELMKRERTVSHRPFSMTGRMHDAYIRALTA